MTSEKTIALTIWTFSGKMMSLLLLLFFFSFFAEKKVLLFPFGPRLERGLQSVKKLPSKCREGLQAALMLRELLKGHWIPEAPSHA